MNKYSDIEKKRDTKSDSSLPPIIEEAKLKMALDYSSDEDATGSDELSTTFAQMRRTALDQIPEKGAARFNRPMAVSLFASIAAAVLIVVMWVPQEGGDSVGSTIELSELDFYSQSEDIAMLSDEDPEFYLWLAHELDNEAS